MEEVKEKEFHLSPIAQPLAGKKLQKRILKLVKRGFDFFSLSNF